MMTIAEDQAASIAAITRMAATDREGLLVLANRATIDLALTMNEAEALPNAGFVELYLNTAHEAAKLLLAARDLVVITDGGVSQAYQYDDFVAWVADHAYRPGMPRPDYREFISEYTPASCEFQLGAPETQALCAALVAAGSKQIDA